MKKYEVPPLFIAHVIKVIETTLEMKGKGKKDDPYRRITQYWSLDGRLLAESDSFTKVKS